MELILAFLAGAVVGSLCGFDRLNFKGKLRKLYSPDGMRWLFSANHVLRKDFESYTAGITAEVLAASLEAEAIKVGCIRYLASVITDKAAVARAFAVERKVREGLVCVLKCVDPCWTFVLNSVATWLVIQGKELRCALPAPLASWVSQECQTSLPRRSPLFVDDNGTHENVLSVPGATL